MSAQERAAEVIQSVTGGPFAGYEGETERIVAALAAAGLLVESTSQGDEDTGSDAGASLPDDDTARLVKLGKAVEATGRNDVPSAAADHRLNYEYEVGWNDCLDAIYREAERQL